MKNVFFIIIALVAFSCGSGVDEVNTDTSDVDTLPVVIDSFALVNDKVNQNPNSSAHLFERAKFYIRHGKVDEAQLDLEKILSIDSSDLDVHLKYADILLAKLDLEGGKYHYEYILERDTMSAGANIGMGKLHALLDNSAEATYYLNEALKIDPYLPEPYFMKGMIYRVDFYKTGRQESWDRAVSSFQTAVEQDPNYYSAYVQMGVMYDRVGDDRALEYYNSALDIYPESLEAWYNKGMYYQTRDDINNALECYRSANDIDSSWADPYYNQGYIHMMMVEDLDSAIYFFDKATYWDPSYFEAYNNLGLAYEKQGNITDAKKYYQKAIEINPDFQLAKDNLNALQ